MVRDMVKVKRPKNSINFLPSCFFEVFDFVESFISELLKKSAAFVCSSYNLMNIKCFKNTESLLVNYHYHWFPEKTIKDYFFVSGLTEVSIDCY